jgi:hypothetical protein
MRQALGDKIHPHSIFSLLERFDFQFVRQRPAGSDNRVECNAWFKSN